MLKYIVRFFDKSVVNEFAIDLVLGIIDESIKNPASQRKYESLLRLIRSRITKAIGE